MNKLNALGNLVMVDGEVRSDAQKNEIYDLKVAVLDDIRNEALDNINKSELFGESVDQVLSRQREYIYEPEVAPYKHTGDELNGI